MLTEKDIYTGKYTNLNDRIKRFPEKITPQAFKRENL